MKKIIFALLLAVSAINANAQVTWNVRAGGGVGSMMIGPTLQFQCNIPFKRNSHWTFSPSVCVSYDMIDFQKLPIWVPLTIGYKVRMGDGNLFFPKLGVAAGVEGAYGKPFVGPTLALDFEIKHFVVGVNGVLSPVDNDFTGTGAYLTFGYKF